MLWQNTSPSSKWSPNGNVLLQGDHNDGEVKTSSLCLIMEEGEQLQPYRIYIMYDCNMIP